MNKTWKIPSCLFIFFFQKRQEEGKVKVFCFCDALWSLGDDNSFYPFRLKCQYDNSLQVENVHFFNIQHSSTTFDNRVPNFYISYAFLIVTDRKFGLAELLLFGLAQMTEPFSAENRTFFLYCTLHFSKWLP